MLLAGDGDLVRQLERSLSSDAYLGFRVVRTVGADASEAVSAARETGVKILEINSHGQACNCEAHYPFCLN